MFVSRTDWGKNNPEPNSEDKLDQIVRIFAKSNYNYIIVMLCQC